MSDYISPIGTLGLDMGGMYSSYGSTFPYCSGGGYGMGYGMMGYSPYNPMFSGYNMNTPIARMYTDPLYYGQIQGQIEKNKAQFKGILSKIFFTMVIAGGVSNLLDRIFRGYVVDFIDVSDLFSFAIFNVADIFIVVGIIGLAICMIFPQFGNIGRKE